MKISPLIGVGALAALTWNREALAADDRAACFEAASQGQTLRDMHKLIEARDQFRVCAQSQCPSSMQADCAGWLEATEKSIPTVIVLATDAAGAGAFDVSVRIDGQPFVAKLDGQAMPTNPGVHTFHFERVDGTSAEQTVQISEGDKNQKVAVVLKTAPAPQPEAAPPPASTPPSAPGMGTQKILGLVGGAAGLAGIVVGSVFGGLTAAEASKQKTDCPRANCSGYAQALNDHSTAVTDGTVSTVAFVAGGALLVGGVVLFLAAPHGPTQPASTGLVIAPSVGPASGGLCVRGEF